MAAPMSVEGPALEVRTLAIAVLATAAGALPVFLLGALAVQVRADLAFSATALGAAASAYFAASAAFSVPAGRLLERVGPTAGVRLGAALSAVALLGIAVVARSWGSLAGFLVLGGMSNSVGQLAANLALARRVEPRRQGLGFGIKQSAVPLATLLAGLAVPLVALTVGWRWAFGGGAACAVALACLTPTWPRPARRAPGPLRAGDTAIGPLVVLAVAAALGTAASNSLGAFHVEASVADGMDAGDAGLLFAAGSVAGIVSRIAVGWRADHRDGRHLPAVARMMAAGAGGFALLALGGGAWLLVVGTLLAFAAGWGWNGLFNYAVVRQNRHAPAAATGITQTGLFVGGVIGPLAFGALAERLSYGVAWAAGAALLLAAAALLLRGRALILADLRLQQAPGR